MRTILLITVASVVMICATMVGAEADQVTGANPHKMNGIKVTVATTQASNGNVDVEVRVAVPEGCQLDFKFGSVSQVFGIYILGPWGWVDPSPHKINWMHQEVAQGQPVSITPDKPWIVRFKLSDYFDLGAVTKDKSAMIQMNVKFFLTGSGMASPADSGAVIIGQ